MPIPRMLYHTGFFYGGERKLTDENYMQTALQLATQAKGQTSPNPAVGCVIVKHNRIVGLGTHLRAGEAHAEIHALHMAGHDAEQATVYVTLEPCQHQGRTGACVDALLQAQVKRVVVATLDANPLVAGSGVKKLRDNGIEVIVGVCEREAQQINEAFFHYITTKMPFVTLKQAISLDGKISANKGQQTAITGNIVQQDVHNARAEHDALLVGSQTILTDNPLLTNRLSANKKQPIRIVIDRQGLLPQHVNVIKDTTVPTWLFTTKSYSFTAHHVRVFLANNWSLEDVLTTIAQAGIMTLYVEGGQQIATSFIQQQLVQRYVLYIAPLLLGTGAVSMAATTTHNQLRIKETATLGNDIKITMEVDTCSQGSLKN